MPSLRTAHLIVLWWFSHVPGGCGISCPPGSFWDIFITDTRIAKEGTKKKARAEYRAGKMEVLQTPHLYGWEKM